ncbi:MAG: hypothetical protein A4S09_15945 [Proteobacteria bacterium SG_bin7]|nr:MAG: hypothetical protein A4S09_15945 [Proteobacteria bacterium SG_bin7]
MFFLTIYFCGIFANAAPDDTVIVPTTPQSEPTAPSTPEEDLRLKTMEITHPKAQEKSLSEQAKYTEDKSFYYPYKRSISPRVGFVFDPDKLRDNKEVVFLFGFVFMLPSDSADHWELGFDVHTGGIGYLQFNRRWVASHTEKFRPFLRAGISSRMKSEQGFASIVNQDNIQLRIGFGFEDLLINPASAAVGMDLGIGMDQTFLAILLGYSWAW